MYSWFLEQSLNILQKMLFLFYLHMFLLLCFFFLSKIFYYLQFGLFESDLYEVIPFLFFFFIYLFPLCIVIFPKFCLLRLFSSIGNVPEKVLFTITIQVFLMAFLISWSLKSLLQNFRLLKKSWCSDVSEYDDALNLKPENTYFSIVLLEILTDG